MEGTERKAK